MSESRVRALSIRLRVPAELEASASELKHKVERDLIARVLDELERLVHAALGSAVVVRMRRLALRWQLEAGELAAPEVVARLARDLSRSMLDELARASAGERLRPRPETIAAFSDEHHASAALLADAADGLPAHWVHAGASAADTWERASSGGSATLAALVTWLVRMERLDAAASLAPPAVLAALEECVPDAAPAVALVRARRGEAPSGVHAATATPAHAAEPLDGAQPAAAASPAIASSPPSHVEVAGKATAAPRTAPDVPAAAAAAPAEAAVTGDPGIAAQTEAAGLFYLVARVLEIDLAERLWAVGLPEGDVLAHVAAALLGGIADPAWRWFGGTFDRTPGLPAVPAWAPPEIEDGVQTALGRRLVRFGIALTPAVLGAQLDHLATALPPPFPLEPVLARIVSRGAAAIACITCARLGVPPSVSTVRAVCTRPGTLVRSAAELHVVIPIRYLDLDYRRAGLDQDPGHVPWLRRTLRIELAGAAEL